MNRENSVKKETPPVLGEATHELSRSLHSPSQVVHRVLEKMHLSKGNSE